MWYIIIVKGRNIKKLNGTIKMFFKPKEHEPSHLHALYGEHIGIFDLCTMEMILFIS